MKVNADLHEYDSLCYELKLIKETHYVSWPIYPAAYSPRDLFDYKHKPVVQCVFIHLISASNK